MTKMLERLLAALANGPSLNCRPHSSRQRVDFSALAKLRDGTAEEVLRAVLGPAGQVKLSAKVAAPRAMDQDIDELTDEQKAARQAWEEQSNLLAKLRGITEDARTYEQDTGVHVLNVGFPLLTLPPALAGGRSRGAGKRIMAPIAFMPVTVTVKSGAGAGVVIACKGGGVDRVIPNMGLLSWLEQQTGKTQPESMFEDEEGEKPWREIGDLVRHVCEVLGIEPVKWGEEGTEARRHEGTKGERSSEFQVPSSESATAGQRPADALNGKGASEARDSEELARDSVAQDSQGNAPGVESASGAQPASHESLPPLASPAEPDASSTSSESEDAAATDDWLKLVPAPRAEDMPDKPAIHLSAVLGLFPMTNQGLLRDMQALSGGESARGPLSSFIHANLSLDVPPEKLTEAPVALAADKPTPTSATGQRVRSFTDERFIAPVDPCQARAVRMARTSKALVIHGPPGTGKSQTITNIIGDHLSRGQRVLLVSDKRTALDVVSERLDRMGLSSLTALIHDPQRDQRELYRAIREQLEALAETTTIDKSQSKVDRIDGELQSLYRELTESWDALMGTAKGHSFHELVGRWLALASSAEFDRVESQGDSIALDDLEHHAHPIDEILTRAGRVQWWANPWRPAAGIELGVFLATPMEKWRAALARCVEVARAADATLDPTIPPFELQIDLKTQGEARADLAARIEQARQRVTPEVRARWTNKDEPAQSRTLKRLMEMDPLLAILRSGSLDPELAMTARERLPTMAELAVMLGDLESYLEVAGSWTAFFHFKRKNAARPVLARYGLPLNQPAAQRLKTFLSGLRTRLVLQSLHFELYEMTGGAGLISDEVLDRTLNEHRELLALLEHVRATPALAPLRGAVIGALQDDAKAATLLQGLKASPARAGALAGLNEGLNAARLFDAKWLASFDATQRKGSEGALPVAEDLAKRLGDVETILRTRTALAGLPAGISKAIHTLAAHPFEPDAARDALHKSSLAAAISKRLASDPRLAAVDSQRLGSVFDRYRKLEEDKRDHVRDAILHQWVSRQKERLLAATGSRLNSMGADLKRRLTLRGERAMRLRQVLAHGQNIDGGDPLFDLRPIWMASPETVAQLFARREVFDVVIFDEASQCRLEETLPVLTRGTRVVIAGDPKQLPPTRFFESAVAQSEDEEVESEQQLFEAQQGEIEDLLGAALNIEIDEAYLDVHYRSRASELIEFSNEHFYNSRLQAIPGHPSNRPETAPLVMHRVQGVYEKRRNEAEAQAVAELVRDLLKGRTPPSIGIACFNLQQRDLIVEKLDELAADDDRFASKLEDSRNLAGGGSFEGLFVKNLENVQGDERDIIIISTTYGPDPSGRFYRRFGPLGKAGGGRRLNVLVTRARHAVHLVTSIPPEVYRALPPVPQGQQPSGGWLLFAYLKYAEEVARGYEEGGTKAARHEGREGEAKDERGRMKGEEKSEDGVQATVLNTRRPSVFAEALAKHLAQSCGLASDVYWGNDGFCVDVAVGSGAQVSLGVLCDVNRFPGADDPVEWDVFRTTIHESQGWALQRVFSPQFFRDPAGMTQAIAKAAGKD